MWTRSYSHYLESISTCNTPPEIKSVQVREYGAEGLRTQEEEEGGETHKEQKGREARRQTNNSIVGGLNRRTKLYIFRELTLQILQYSLSIFQRK